jgi:ABC-type uncharacterized transport system substrate-binding protein
VQIDYRWGVSGPERAQAAIGELLTLAPDLILSHSVSATRAAQQATRTVPIVFTAVSEPMALGFVASLARPGGNITGFSNLEPSVGGKWLELLKEIAPHTNRVAIMFNPSSTGIAAQFVRAARSAAPTFAIDIVEAKIRLASDIEPVLAKLKDHSGTALLVLPDTFLAFHYKLIVELAARYSLPAIYAFRYYAAAGGLVSYGPDISDQFRRAASYVDRILRGEKAGELPVQQPVKFEFVINLKSARALGLSIPLHLQQIADEVIE